MSRLTVLASSSAVIFALDTETGALKWRSAPLIEEGEVCKWRALETRVDEAKQVTISATAHVHRLVSLLCCKFGLLHPAEPLVTGYCRNGGTYAAARSYEWLGDI